jgi:hypothetical protein
MQPTSRTLIRCERRRRTVRPIQWVLVGLILTLCGYFGPYNFGMIEFIGLVILIIGLIKAHHREHRR